MYSPPRGVTQQDSDAASCQSNYFGHLLLLLLFDTVYVVEGVAAAGKATCAMSAF